LLDELKVPDHHPATGKTPSRMTLHARIEKYGTLAKKNKTNGQVLLAIKWLGNSGSHSGGLTREDVLMAFDMLELVLTNLYSNTKQEIMRQVKAVNKAKGPMPKGPAKRKK
ncbi:MAG: DUF4145 domain-containing protein, partial [Verrucomicrobiaceae bacterium]